MDSSSLVENKERIHSEVKEKMRSRVNAVKLKLNDIIEHNENAPEIERLPIDQLTIDLELKEKLKAEGDVRVKKERADILMQNVSIDLMIQRLKDEFWDLMEQRAIILKPFKRNFEVLNFSLKKRTPAQLSRLSQIKQLRRVELVEFRIRKTELSTAFYTGSMRALDLRMNFPFMPVIGKTSTVSNTNAPTNATNTTNTTTTATTQQALQTVPTTNSVSSVVTAPTSETENKDEQDELDLEETPDYDWSMLLYDPFDLYTPQRKITQIHILNHMVYCIKTTFNQEFLKCLETKKNEIQRIKEKNERMVEILQELYGENYQDRVNVWYPTLVDCEVPESVWLKETTQETSVSRTAPKINVNNINNSTSAADRALKMMMGGNLEGNTPGHTLEDDLLPPAFMETKTVEEMSEDEIKIMKEYETKKEVLREEREKHKKALETELKKLQSQVEDICVAFDEKLHQIKLLKMSTDQNILEHELRISKLGQGLLLEETAEIRFESLTKELGELKKEKNNSTVSLTSFKAKVDSQKEELDALIAADRGLEKATRRDIERDLGDRFEMMWRIYRRRPQKLPENNQGADFETNSMSNIFDGEFKPENVEEDVWNRVLDARAQKIKAEADVRKKQSELNELVKVYLDMQTKDDNLRSRFEDIMKQIRDDSSTRMIESANLEVLFKLKQGQVEVEEGSFVTDYSDSVFIHRSSIEELNKSIQALAKEKVAFLKEIKNTRRLIRKKRWENLGLDMIAEDYHEKTKYFQLLRVTKQLQEFIKSGEEDQHAIENAILEKRSEHSRKTHEQKVEDRHRVIEKLERMIKAKQQENHSLGRNLKDLKTTVTEKKETYLTNTTKAWESVGGIANYDNFGVSGGKSKSAVQIRVEKLVKGKKLAEKVRQQQEEILSLEETLETLRKRTFPSFESNPMAASLTTTTTRLPPISKR